MYNYRPFAAVRPKNFFSSLRLGIGTYVYKKFASRVLIDVLSAVGISASYSDVRNYEQTAIRRPDRRILLPSFTQFVFDNADFKVNSLDGLNNFHAMGGIQCITPGSAIEPDVPVERRRKGRHSAHNNGEKGYVDIVPCFVEKNVGLQNIPVVDLPEIRQVYEKMLPTTGDFIWLYGKWACLENVLGWNGFMEQVTNGESYDKTKIIIH